MKAKRYVVFYQDPNDIPKPLAQEQFYDEVETAKERAESLKRSWPGTRYFIFEFLGEVKQTHPRYEFVYQLCPEA